EFESFSQRRGIRPRTPRERLANDGDGKCTFAIGFIERAAANDRHAERREVVGRHGFEVEAWVRGCFVRSLALPRKRRVPSVRSRERSQQHWRRGGNTRSSLQAGDELVEHLQAPFGI